MEPSESEKGARALYAVWLPRWEFKHMKTFSLGTLAKCWKSRLMRLPLVASLGSIATHKVVGTFVAINVPTIFSISGNVWLMLGGGILASIIVEAVSSI
jgi:hypothetical protein